MKIERCRYGSRFTSKVLADNECRGMGKGYSAGNENTVSSYTFTIGSDTNDQYRIEMTPTEFDKLVEYFNR